MRKSYYVVVGVVVLVALAFVLGLKALLNNPPDVNGQQAASTPQTVNNEQPGGTAPNASDQSVGNNPPNGKFTEFLYQDPTVPNLIATVYLPESAGQWGVQNPYKGADESIIKSPQVFVKAAFQNINDPTIYGLIRVVYDLQGVDCYTFFTGLAQLNGLRLQTYTSTTSNQIKEAKSYVFEYYQDQRNLLAGSKVVCDDKYGLELFVVAPDTKANYGAIVQTILQYATLTIPGTPTGALGQQ